MVLRREDFKREFGLIVVGALIFTASFLWKDLLTDVEEKFFPKSKGLLGRLIFVLIVTFGLVVLSIELKDILGLSTSSNPFQFDDSPLDRSSGDDHINDISFDGSIGHESFQNTMTDKVQENEQKSIYAYNHDKIYYQI